MTHRFQPSANGKGKNFFNAVKLLSKFKLEKVGVACATKFFRQLLKEKKSEGHEQYDLPKHDKIRLIRLPFSLTSILTKTTV